MPVPIAPEDLAIAWAYLSDDDGSDEPWFEAAVIDLIASIQSGRYPFWLFGGLVGKAWTIAHIGDEEVGTYLTSFDEHLVATLRHSDWNIKAYDVVSGLAGIGVYGLERWQRGDRNIAGAIMPLVQQRLAELATRDNAGCRWIGKENTLDVVDCGLAHGAAGAIAVLASMTHTGVIDASKMVKETTQWLYEQMLPDTGQGRFPARVAPGHASRPTRLAWCYGDLGIAAGLWLAARRLGWDEGPSQAIARGCAQRDVDTAGVKDAAICHGAIGNAHIFNRFYQASGEALFRDAANLWYRRAFTYIQPDLAFGGFGCWRNAEPPGTSQIVSNGSLLEGAIGVALGLAAATSHTEPGWDRILAVDIPLPPL